MNWQSWRLENLNVPIIIIIIIYKSTTINWKDKNSCGSCVASSVEKLWYSSGVPVRNCGSKKRFTRRVTDEET